MELPMLKPISGHTGCRRIREYLDKGGRALAHDFFNLSWDERDMEGYDEDGKSHVYWDEEMDETRERFGNNTPVRGRNARTFKHFVLSPDPEDGISLDALRELSCAWVLKHFADFQIAITYHDDNENGIPHAHIVVNNTNLATGRRLHTDNPLSLNRDLQNMARERGLSGLSNVKETDEGLARLAAKETPLRAHPRSMQQVYLGRQEKEIVACGAYSWVADIRNRVSVAKSLSRNENEFRQILDMLNVSITGNSNKAQRDDWIYLLADEPAKRVSGGRLGLLFAKETVQGEFERKETYHPSAKSSRELLRNARNAVLVNNLHDLDQLSIALGTCARNGVSSLEECDRRISSLLKRAEHAEGPREERLRTSAHELTQARDFMASRQLLPSHVEKKKPRDKARKVGNSGLRESSKPRPSSKQVRSREQTPPYKSEERKER